MPKSRILYIEDDEVDIMYLTRSLKSLSPEIDLTVVGSFSDAQAVLNESKIDLVITDNQLKDGYLTDHSRMLNGIPFILTSGIDASELERIAKKAGANAYMEKPIDTTILLKKIDTILGHNNWSTVSESASKQEFDLKSLLAFSGGDNSFALDMMTMLRERFPSDLIRMKEALMETDRTIIGHLAHNLKSSFLIFKHGELASICEKIESTTKNDGEVSDLEPLISTLDESGSEFMGYLGQVMTELKKEEN